MPKYFHGPRTLPLDNILLQMICPCRHFMRYLPFLAKATLIGFGSDYGLFGKKFQNFQNFRWFSNSNSKFWEIQNLFQLRNFGNFQKFDISEYIRNSEWFWIPNFHKLFGILWFYAKDSPKEHKVTDTVVVVHPCSLVSHHVGDPKNKADLDISIKFLTQLEESHKISSIWVTRRMWFLWNSLLYIKCFYKSTPIRNYISEKCGVLEMYKWFQFRLEFFGITIFGIWIFDMMLPKSEKFGFNIGNFRISIPNDNPSDTDWPPLTPHTLLGKAAFIGKCGHL